MHNAAVLDGRYSIDGDDEDDDAVKVSSDFSFERCGFLISDDLQGSAKRWALGCVNQREPGGGILLLADPCTERGGLSFARF